VGENVNLSKPFNIEFSSGKLCGLILRLAAGTGEMRERDRAGELSI
jgi:hypothetical protein